MPTLQCCVLAECWHLINFCVYMCACLQMQRKAPKIGGLHWSVQYSSRRITVSDLDAVARMEDQDAWRSALCDAKFELGQGE